MKVVSFDKIKELDLDLMTCYKWVCNLIKEKKNTILPAKISLKPEMEGVFYNTMPAIIPFEKWAGVKLVTRYPGREPSLDSEILLYDLTSGENIAIMDGNWITAIRTGAVAVHTINLFAVKKFEQIGIIGLGNTARAAMKILLAVYPNRKLTIKLKTYKNQHILFAQEFACYKNLNFIYKDTYNEVINDSDIVLSAATVLKNNVCADDCFKEGVLVVPIHTRGFMNCDLFFDKIFADDTNHVREFKYFNQYKYFAEVSDVVNQIKAGRENDRERIIVYNIGIAIHDIYFAGKIYELLKESCEDISLSAPNDKF